jgi:hypothetical protein
VLFLTINKIQLLPSDTFNYRYHVEISKIFAKSYMELAASLAYILFVAIYACKLMPPFLKLSEVTVVLLVLLWVKSFPTVLFVS